MFIISKIKFIDYTKEQFLNYLEDIEYGWSRSKDPKNPIDKITCPEDLKLEQFYKGKNNINKEKSTCGVGSCKECWRIAIEHVVFKDKESLIFNTSEKSNKIKMLMLPVKTNTLNLPPEILMRNVKKDMEFEEKFKTIRDNNEKWTKEQYEKMGIKIIDKYDELFYFVELPNEWEFYNTGNQIYNTVKDEKGRQRITIFYNKTLSNVDVFSNFEKRYSYYTMPFDNFEVGILKTKDNLKEWYGIVCDCGKEIYRTESIKNDLNTVMHDECKKYLNSNYPNWQDINAYWNE